MARIRSIHPDACKSEKLDACSPEAERCFWRLLPHCDDEGRAEDDPRILRSLMFAVREHLPSAKVDAWLQELHDRGLVLRYEAEGRRYLVVTTWSYQRPNRPTPSRLPAPPEHVTDDSVMGQGDVPLGGRRRANEAFADDFDRLWMNYPRKIDKQAAFKAYQARRREGAPPVLLEAAVGYYAKSVVGVEARYVKHGKTFFAKDGPWVEWQHGPPAAELAAVIPGPRIPARPEAIYQMPASAPMCPTCESSLLACLCPR